MDSARARVLVIDDTPANLMVLATAMSGEFVFQLATSGPGGLELAQNSPPDLVLLDVMMPGVDGFATCRRFKSLPALAHIPIVFVTALSDTESEVEGLRLGAADFIHKPIQVDIARQRIRNLLEREALRRALQASKQHLETAVAQRTAELELSNTELALAKEAAEAAYRVKSSFLANMSHELLTPLNTVTGMAGLLTARLSDPELRTLSRSVEDASRKLLNIINDMLFLARSEGQVGKVPLEAFDLETFVREVVSQHQDPARQKGLALHYSIGSRIPYELLGQPVRLKQVLAHLLSNAIKFSERGTIALRVEYEGRGLTQIQVRFVVADQGVGMAPEVLQRLGEAYFQGDGSSTRKYGGLGTGLAVVHFLTQLMGAQLGVESAPGCGSEFWVSVPFELEADDPQPVFRSTVNGGLEDDPVTLQMVDDDPTHLSPEQQAQLTRLIDWLAVGDIDAQALWKEVRPWFKPWIGKRLGAFDHAMEVYDFDAAAALLHQVVQAHGALQQRGGA
jgi:signal transduction histidine kinase